MIMVSMNINIDMDIFFWHFRVFSLTGSACRRFFRPSRSGLYIPCQDVHPKHAGDVRGPALPHGSAVRSHYQARDAGVEGQVESGATCRGPASAPPAGQHGPIHPTHHSPSWAGEGHWGRQSELEGGDWCLDSCCVCIFVAPPTVTMGPRFNCYTHFVFLFPSLPESQRINLPSADRRESFPPPSERICVLCEHASTNRLCSLQLQALMSETLFCFPTERFYLLLTLGCLDCGSREFRVFLLFVFLLLAGWCAQVADCRSFWHKRFRKPPIPEDVLTDNWTDVCLCLSARPSERISFFNYVNEFCSSWVGTFPTHLSFLGWFLGCIWREYMAHVNFQHWRCLKPSRRRQIYSPEETTDKKRFQSVHL